MKYLLLLLLATISFANCQTNLTSCRCPIPLNVGTFDADLLFLTPYTSDRLEGLVNYFNNSNLDIVCMQGIFDPNTRDSVISDLDSTYAYSYFSPKNPNIVQNCTDTPCGRNALDSLKNCFSNIGDCLSTDPSEISDCLQSKCGNQYNNLPDTCKQCLEVDTNLTFAQRINFCTPNDPDFSTNCVKFLNGYSDNLILSKFPLANTATRFLSPGQGRVIAALYAQTNFSEIGMVDIYCTHLTPDVPVVDLQGENLNEVKNLLDFIDSTSQTNKVLLMGNFNNGPAIGSNEGQWVDNYETILNDGFVDLLVAADGNETGCTVCSQNGLVQPKSDQLLDHIFYKHFNGTCLVNAVIFANVSVVRGTGTVILGQQVLPDISSIPLSDHYGIAAAICPGPRNFPTPKFSRQTNGMESLVVSKVIVVLLFAFISAMFY